MTSEAMRLKSPRDLLAIIPYLFGFHPRDSIVLICLHAGQVGLTQRLDLPRPGESRVVAQTALAAVLREQPDQVLLIGYAQGLDASNEGIEAMTEALTAAGIPIHDRIVVHDRTWRSLDCHEATCCPPEGQPVPHPVEVPHLASEFVGHEQSPFADREALAAQLEAGPEALSPADLNVAETPEMDGLLDVWRRVLDGSDSPAEVTPAIAAAASASLRDVHVRDALVARLTPGTLEGSHLADGVQPLLAGLGRGWGTNGPDSATIVAMIRIQARLIRLCTMLPDQNAAPALTLLACFTWWRGNGALTRVALDRALRCQPDYRLAQLLQRMVDLAIRPQRRP